MVQDYNIVPFFWKHVTYMFEGIPWTNDTSIILFKYKYLFCHQVKKSNMFRYSYSHDTFHSMIELINCCLKWSQQSIKVHYENKFTNNIHSNCFKGHLLQSLPSFFSPTCSKAKFREIFIYSNTFLHNFHLSESSSTCPGLRASGLAWRLPLYNKSLSIKGSLISPINE